MRVSLAFLPANLVMAVLSLGLSAKLVMRFGIKIPLVAGMAGTTWPLQWARCPQPLPRYSVPFCFQPEAQTSSRRPKALAYPSRFPAPVEMAGVRASLCWRSIVPAHDAVMETSHAIPSYPVFE
jgi:hypothetical protein